jgi:hypothetical protein
MFTSHDEKSFSLTLLVVVQRIIYEQSRNGTPKPLFFASLKFFQQKFSLSRLADYDDNVQCTLMDAHSPKKRIKLKKKLFSHNNNNILERIDALF